MAVNTSLDVARIKKDFPILDRVINGTRLVYLDSAATSQKPRQVLDAMERYYETCNANVHRSVYQIATEATEAYETARLKVKRFINAPSEREVIFTKNATEGLNLVAHSWGRTNLREGDIVVLTHMEHHANIVPWHILAAERGSFCAGAADPGGRSTSPISISCSTERRHSASLRCRTCSGRSTLFVS
jgi:cysteine desulfurase/selenocysteine lyase